MKDEGYQLWLGDCLEQMSRIEAGSVDAIIADLPFNSTACAWDKLIPFEPLWKHYKRVIKPRGAVVLFGSQPFTTDLINSNREWFKYSLVWDKVLGGNHLNASFQPLKTHEDICVFSPSASTFSPRGSMVYNPQIWFSEPYTKTHKQALRKDIYRSPYKHPPVSENKMGERYPVSIIQISNANRDKDHPTQKPVALMEYLIKTYTNEGETVLDNTFGSASCGEAALRMGRRFIGIEKDAGYFEIGKARMERVAAELRGELNHLPLFAEPRPELIEGGA